jgi:Helix-turn-helix of DDE superfamily endonuclease
MAKYDTVKTLTDTNFRRLTGVKRTTFETMLSVLSSEIEKNKRIKGRPSVLNEADQLLMMLEYNREYRTYFHISQSYQVSEPTAYRLISRAENLLIKSGKFSLAGKKTLLDSQIAYETIIIDATESKIERPQKNKELITQPRKNIII